MDKEYMTLVLAKHDNNNMVYLFRAPRGTYFDEGQRITVETRRGYAEATVVKTESYETEDSKLTQMLIAATGATLPLARVVAKQVPIEWPEVVVDEVKEEE